MPRKPVAFRVIVRTLPKASRQRNGPQAPQRRRSRLLLEALDAPGPGGSGRAGVGAAGSIRGMRSRRGARKGRPRNQDNPIDVLLEQDDPTPPASEPASVDHVLGRSIEVLHSFWVQPADLVPCDVDGCTDPAEPEAWEPVDLDTGDELPGRFCDDHQLAWITRPRESTSTAGDLVSP